MMRSSAAGASRVAVAIVSTYPSVRAGLQSLLSEDSRIEVVAEAAGLRDLLVENGRPIEVAVVDLDLDVLLDGPEELEAFPAEVGAVILGPAAADPRLVDLLGERAWAYLLREAGAIELARAVEAVAAGFIVVQPPLAQRLFAAGPRELTTVGEETLTPREHEVLQLVAEGLPNKTIATKLAISEHTVKFHITSILSKLDASSRTEAVRLGARRGLITL
jgi:DNA-binding NarL/FixJ family response regulator